jgi:integrase
MDRVELPKSEKKEPKVLDKQGVDQLLSAAAGTRLFPLLMLAAATGCRRGELLALKWEDVDFATGIVTIAKSLEETNAGLRVKSTKSRKPRRFKVPEKALDSLKEHRTVQEHDQRMFGRDYRDHGLIFSRPDGEYYKPDKVSVRVTELAAKAGLKGIGLHSMRHSHASQLLSSGVPIPTVSKRLGHANPNITLSIYSHALEADELAAAKIWDDAMVDVISENKKREPERMLAHVSPNDPKKAVNG